VAHDPAIPIMPLPLFPNASLSRSGDISVFDTGTGKELSSLPIGKGVDDLAFDSASKRLYAPCGSDGLIYIYEQRAQRGKDRYRSPRAA
jgi:WD40 repeat protein